MLNRWSEYSQNDEWMGHTISGLYKQTNACACAHTHIHTEANTHSGYESIKRKDKNLLSPQSSWFEICSMCYASLCHLWIQRKCYFHTELVFILWRKIYSISWKICFYLIYKCTNDYFISNKVLQLNFIFLIADISSSF